MFSNHDQIISESINYNLADILKILKELLKEKTNQRSIFKRIQLEKAFNAAENIISDEGLFTSDQIKILKEMLHVIYYGLNRNILIF